MEESEYAGLAGRRVVPPVAFVPRGVDVKRDQSPTPIQFRSRPRASLTLLMRLEGSQCDWQIRPCLNSTQSYGGRGAKKARSDRRLYQALYRSDGEVKCVSERARRAETPAASARSCV